MGRRTAGSSKAGQVRNGALGRALVNDHRKRAEQVLEVRAEKATGVAHSQAARSVLEQSSLDDFLAQAALARATFPAERRPGIHLFTGEGPTIVSAPSDTPQGHAAAAAAAEQAQRVAAQLVVPIPWRPQWAPGTSPEDLQHLEGQAFLDWRRGLAQLEEQEGVVMTPYERNLDFWRQLWRCVERSDLLVQIVDARDPMFYRSRDLERYVRTRFGESKRLLLLLNKSDFLTPALRRRWAAYLAESGVDAVFFSALRELHRQQLLVPAPAASDAAGAAPAAGASGSAPGEADGEADCEDEGGEGEGEGDAPPRLPPHGPLESADDEPDVLNTAQLLEELRARLPPAAAEQGSRRAAVGFVGYPNVGKSSVINALWGAKKVSMSRTPGKTKHLQTLELPGADLTLCDCPGLVFPSVVATKAHLAINGTVPLVELKDYVQPVRLVVEKVGMERLLEKYALTEAAMQSGVARLGEDVDRARRFLAGLAADRRHFLRYGVPDETWSARKVLRDYTTGELLHCEPPPDSGGPPAAPPPPPQAAVDVAGRAAAPTDADRGDQEGSSGSDFGDLDAFLNGEDRDRGAGAVGYRGARRKAAGRRGGEAR